MWGNVILGLKFYKDNNKQKGKIMIAVTGANGKLGNLVIQELLKRTDAKNIVAIVRNPEKAENLQALGIKVRKGDYDQFDSLVNSLQGIEKLLLISSSEIGKRALQHNSVIKAAGEAKVKTIVYTSILNADTSKLLLAEEHKATEKTILASGLKYTILRNGWYLENHTENLASAFQFGIIMGASGEGHFSSASRLDYATAAAVVLVETGHDNKIYELAGDHFFTMKELAIEVSHHSQRNINYQDMAESEYEKALVGFGLPQTFAHLLADSESGAKNGHLESKSKDLSKLIGRETTTLSQCVLFAVNNK